MQQRQKILIGVLVVVAAIAYLVVSGFGGNTGYQVTITELLQGQEKYNGRYILTEAKLVPKSAQWDSQKVELRFEATDGQDKVQVLYNDVAPDNFYDPEAQLILKGRLQDGIFRAEKIETRCPSKYEALPEDAKRQQLTK